MIKLLVLLATCCVVLTFAKLPDYITKCSIKGPDFDACVLKSARKALPHLMKGDARLKFPPMDPLFITEMAFHESGLDAAMLNTTVTGFKDMILEKLRYDQNKKEVMFQGVVPSLNFTGNYVVDGKVATLPVSGNGPFYASFLNLSMNFKATYDLVKLDDGKVYMVFQSYDADMKPEQMRCHLDNMFNGNKMLGDIINTFLNENWRAMYKEYGKPTSLAMGRLLFHIFSESGKIVPFNELFEDVE